MLVPHTGTLNPSDMNRRHRAYIPELLRNQDPSKFPPIYIYNIFDREHQIPCGSRGLKTIPACQPGKAYSEPLVLRAVEVDEYDLADGSGNMSFTADEGMLVAKDIIGIGSTFNQVGLYTTNLEWWGVFLSSSNPPTPEELRRAKSNLTKLMRHIFEHGKRLASAGPNGLAQICENHNIAAKFLGEQTPWATAPTEARTSCPVCGEAIMPSAKKCKHCNEWLDGRTSDEPAAEVAALAKSAKKK